MKLVYSERFLKALRESPPPVQKAFLKQSRFLREDLLHPSLRAKKYEIRAQRKGPRRKVHHVFMRYIAV